MTLGIRPAEHLSSSSSSVMAQVIVVGGGLAGLSAAHTLLERGANVVLLDKQGSVQSLFRSKFLIQSKFYGRKLYKGNVWNKRRWYCLATTTWYSG